jgi:hypothetical protein
MKQAVIVVRGKSGHQQSWGGAFAEGLSRHGWRVSLQGHPGACDLLVLWGVRNQLAIKAQKCAGGEACILERGYVGDRFSWTSVSFGGQLNGRATFRGPFHDGSRWERHHAHLLKPWREKRGGYALLIGQVPGDMSLAGVDIHAWYRRAAAELRSAGWDVRFRPHPVAVQRGYSSAMQDVPTIGRDLASALEAAGLVVTFSSNTAVESVLAGVPTIACDQGSMAHPVTSHTVGDPIVMPDRTAWAHALAWKQWRMDEMQSGSCWDAVAPRQSSATEIVCRAS